MAESSPASSDIRKKRKNEKDEKWIEKDSLIHFWWLNNIASGFSRELKSDIESAHTSLRTYACGDMKHVLWFHYAIIYGLLY